MKQKSIRVNFCFVNVICTYRCSRGIKTLMNECGIYLCEVAMEFDYESFNSTLNMTMNNAAI